MDSREQKFTESYKEHADALFRYCFLKVSDRELAKDLVQSACLKSWQYIVNGGVVDNMKAFLFTTARNLVIDEYRKKKPVSLDALTEGGFDVGVDSQERVENRLDGERAMRFLSAIPKMYRDVIYLQHVEGLSIREIAEIVGESENNVSVRIHRGLQKLRDIMRQS